MKHLKKYRLYESKDSLHEIILTLKDIYQELTDEGFKDHINVFGVTNDIIDMNIDKGWANRDMSFDKWGLIEFDPRLLIDCIKRSNNYMSEQGYEISIEIYNSSGDRRFFMSYGEDEIDRINDVRPLVTMVKVRFKKK